MTTKGPKAAMKTRHCYTAVEPVSSVALLERASNERTAAESARLLAVNVSRRDIEEVT